MKGRTTVGGGIINCGGLSSPRPDDIAFTAGKHAITGLTKSLCLDGRKYDIACSQIVLGNAQRPTPEHERRGKRQADGSIAHEPAIDVKHVGDIVLAMVDMPLAG